MKFQLAINLERTDDSYDMADVRDHTLKMVQKADKAGFNIVWAAEHHALEMTIAPNPFQILTWLANHTDRIRLGTGVVNAAYWHPINLAGEAAFLDLISDGRLEFGIGSGAYQREFDRMKPGLKQTDSWRYMQEMLPVVKALWQGDVEHNGEFWQFPKATSVPKPVQKPHPPVWVAARAPITFDYAVENGCNIMSWPLMAPFSEAEAYKERLDASIAASSTGNKPIFAMMRHAAVYETEDHRDRIMAALRVGLAMFGSLMKQSGDVVNGFPDQIPLAALEGTPFYDPNTLEENLMFGSPDQVIAKLKRYEALGVDEFIYYCSMGMSHEDQQHSLDLFCNEVMPAFA